MTRSKKIAVSKPKKLPVSKNSRHVDHLFEDLDPVDPFEFKKDLISAELAALASFSGKTRTSLSQELGWPKSRVSAVLSGHNNLTLKTVYEFVSHCNHDFGLVFVKSGEKLPIQPWHIQNPVIANTVTVEAPVANVGPSFLIQTAQQVAVDLIHGNHQRFYISLVSDNGQAPPVMRDINPVQQLGTSSSSTSVFPGIKVSSFVRE